MWDEQECKSYCLPVSFCVSCQQGVYLVASFNVNITQAEFILEEGTSIEKIPLSDWPVGKPVVHILDCWLIWEAQITLGSGIPGLMIMSVEENSLSKPEEVS